MQRNGANLTVASVGIVFGKQDSVSTERMLTRIKLLTSFMATDRKVMLQYWRENLLIDLTGDLQRLTVPILDIQSFSGKDQKNQKEQYLETLRLAKAPVHVNTVFMYDTKHFIMYHRPLELDCLIENFIAGKKLVDFAPVTSEYFEEEVIN